MNIEEFWEGFTSSEKDLFQKSCRRLLKQTFIVRDRDEESKRAYYFISKNPEPFSVYLGYIGFDVLTDRENGVVMLRNCRDMGENGRLQINHVALKKMERRSALLPLGHVCGPDPRGKPFQKYHSYTDGSSL